MKIYVNEKEFSALCDATAQFDDLASSADGESAKDLFETLKQLRSLIEKCKKSYGRGE
jgi:hypothetical protein